MTDDLIARIEGLTRSGSIAPGLALRTYDPAWLLARQWTFGEFDGVDGGTPVTASASMEISRIDAVHMAGATLPHDPALVPLDALVQRRAGRAQAAWTVRERIDVGREFLHALAEHGCAADGPTIIAVYGFEPSTEDQRAADPAGAALLDLMVGRLPDGAVLHAAIGTAGATPPELPADTDRSAAADDWRAWLAATLDEPGEGEPGPAWVPERLEHSFSVSSASQDGSLTAPDQRGDLDWYSFDLAAGPAATAAPETVTVVRVPTPITFRGMPARRLWEVEDQSVDLGATEAGPPDLARMALIEFALVYGNDVFAFPATVPIGSLTSVRSLDVADNFGVSTQVTPAVRASVDGRDGWSFHALSSAGGPVPMLFVPNVARHALRGPALEDSALLRDEMANLAWAVERLIEGGDGRALARAEAEATSATAAPTPSVHAPLHYVPQTTVPPSWFPMVLAAGPPRMLSLETLAPSTAPPLGELLPRPGQGVHDEEVPREGVHLLREPVLARWCDGSTRVWIRARREVGRGEGSSGLRFDQAEPTP